MNAGVCTSYHWNEDEIAELCRLWKAGDSASQIARQLNRRGGRFFTRNAVIGKVTRLGLSGRQTPSRPVRLPTHKPRSAYKQAKDAGVLPFTTQPMPVFDASDAPESLKIPLMQLEPGQCKWSTHEEAEHLFCGHPQHADSPWCEHHAAKAVTRDSDRKMRSAQRVVEYFVGQERRAA